LFVVYKVGLTRQNRYYDIHWGLFQVVFCLWCLCRYQNSAGWRFFSVLRMSSGVATCQASCRTAAGRCL